VFFSPRTASTRRRSALPGGGGQVAFAGDGFPDVQAARLVPPELRFARGALAESLANWGESFRPFVVWSDIAQALTADRRPAK
jgi:2-hydroxy-3-keto-5-methylthiopentenyl-1-phosphate phosphatase